MRSGGARCGELAGLHAEAAYVCPPAAWQGGAGGAARGERAGLPEAAGRRVCDGISSHLPLSPSTLAQPSRSSLRSARIERVQREAVFKRLLDRCKRVRQCPRCGVDNGVVKKAPSSLKIVHDPYSKNARLSGM